MYRIGMFSKLGKVTVKTLRHYDEVGLLAPARVDGETGYRYYTTEQLFRLHEIVSLRQMGFSVAEVAAIVDGRDMAGIFERRKTELEAERDTAAGRLFRLQHYRKQQEEGGCMEYQVAVKDIPACVVFSARQVLPGHAALLAAVPAVGKKVGEANRGLTCAEPDYCFTVFHGDEFREKDIDVEICQAVTRRGKDGEGFVFKDMPAVTVASVLHRGAYEDLGAAYAYVFRWMEENGYEAAGLPRESYIDGCWNKENVADWLTELQIPVAKRG